MAVLLFLALFLSFTSYSSATYCLCKAGAADPTTYQKVIDYACGAGADCRAIQPNGPCYVSNNPKAICDYAANSYFQNKGQVPGSCVFSNVAAPSDTPPTTVPAGCTFPNSGSPVSTTGIPTSTPGGISTGTGTGTGTPGTSTGIFSPTTLGPSGGVPDFNSDSPSTYAQLRGTLLLLILVVVSGLLILWA